MRRVCMWNVAEGELTAVSCAEGTEIVGVDCPDGDIRVFTSEPSPAEMNMDAPLSMLVFEVITIGELYDGRIKLVAGTVDTPNGYRVVIYQNSK